MDGASSQQSIQPTTPARWLSSHPAKENVQIQENTSWSCHHGISRWTGCCSCTPGDRQWKINLHAALKRLGDDLDRIYIETTLPLIEDPWQLRNRYIYVLLGQLKIETLLAESSYRALSSDETRRIHLLLEAQRERQRMFTSCGGFFEDFDRIEPQYNVAYAAQAAKLVLLATGIDLESQTAADLAKVISQSTGLSADVIFRRHLRRADSFREIRVGYAD